MTDVTTGQDQDGAELSAANEQLLRELTRAGPHRRAEADRRGRPARQADQDGGRGRPGGSSRIIWAMRRMTRRGVMAAIPVMATGPRPCSPMPGRWRATGRCRRRRCRPHKQVSTRRSLPFDAEMVLTGLLGMKPPRTESKLMNLLHECHTKLIFRGKGLLALLVWSTRAETGLSGSSDTNCHMGKFLRLIRGSG